MARVIGIAEQEGTMNSAERPRERGAGAEPAGGEGEE
jgi:hypothetical protein